MLGTDAKALLFSGDDVADRADQREFLSAYDEKHEVVVFGDDTAALVVGAADWPMPIPLVRHGNRWQFDPDRGRDEVIARRVGRNELFTIETCRAVVDAQQEFFAQSGAYARRFMSNPGTHDGLYWPTQPGEAESPLGSLVAEAESDGYVAGNLSRAGPRPYHGYCYRMLTSQGPWAPGGARSYFINDRLEQGFAIIAYPVEYGQSGVLTFAVCRNGVVYQRDLGSSSTEQARRVQAFDPDAGWSVVSVGLP